MKSRKTRFTALALVALTSALFLGACGGQKQAITTTSSSKTSQSTKASSTASSSSKAKSDKKTQASSATEKAVTSENAGESKQASSEKVAEEPKQEEKQEQATAADKKTDNGSSIDVNAMVNGDFSSVAGTYQNDLGDSITVSPSGSVTYTRASDGSTDTSSKLLDGHEQESGYVAAFSHNDGPSSDPIFFDSNGQVRFGSDAEYGKQHAFSKVG